MDWRAMVGLLLIGWTTSGAAFPFVIAHRGASSLGPENTLAAAQLARELGADGWEFDVQLTKDGELILMHDDTLARTTNAAEVFPERSPWRVADFTLAEIKRLDAGSWFLATDPFGTIALSEVPPKRAVRYAGEPVPTLREALMLSRELELRVYIELKAGYFWITVQGRKLAEQTIALVRELEMEGTTVISSFNHDLVHYVSEIAPEITTAPIFQWLPSDPFGDLRRLGAKAISLASSAYDPQVAKKLSEAGFAVYVWTVDAPEALARFAREPNITGIMTNYPKRLLALHSQS